MLDIATGPVKYNIALFFTTCVSSPSQMAGGERRTYHVRASFSRYLKWDGIIIVQSRLVVTGQVCRSLCFTKLPRGRQLPFAVPP
jgi:hypothetical protein